MSSGGMLLGGVYIVAVIFLVGEVWCEWWV